VHASNGQLNTVRYVGIEPLMVLDMFDLTTELTPDDLQPQWFQGGAVFPCGPRAAD
jgi:hypothetical protein